MIKVVIDPGHGGEDRYNRGPSGYIEADGVLMISKYLKAELEATGQFEVILTRNCDMSMSLTARGQMATQFKADLFIAEHTDAGPSGAGGTTVYYSIDIPGDKDFAENLSEGISSVLGIRNRGAKIRPDKSGAEDYYTVIDVAQDGGVPHVLLIESAFHSNPEEEALLKDQRKLVAIARAQAKVIIDFFKVSIKEEVKGMSITVLRRGDKGEEVKKLQSDLNKLGYALTVDGSFGPATENVVMLFQERNKLEVDGIAGPKTQAKIEDLLVAPKEQDWKTMYNEKVFENNLLKSQIQELKNKLSQINNISRV